MSDLRTFLSGAPVVGRETVKFLEVVTVGGEPREVEIEREVLWLRESEARNEMRHGGEYLHENEGSCWTDFWYGSDVAKGICRRLKVTADSTLEVLVEGRVYDQPVLFSKAPEREGWKTKYAYLPREWRLRTWESEETEEGCSDRWHPRLKEREVEPWTTLWSSKWHDPDGEHANMVEKWKSTYMEEALEVLTRLL